jgi:hypothetical protein
MLAHASNGNLLHPIDSQATQLQQQTSSNIPPAAAVAAGDSMVAQCNPEAHLKKTIQAAWQQHQKTCNR